MLRLSLRIVPVVLLAACPYDEPILTGAETSESPGTDTPTTAAATGTETGSESSGGSSSGDTTGPVAPAVCGNGFVEEGEPCDDGNDEPEDGCNSKCERTGVAIWTQSWDSGAAQDDRALAVALDADGNIYVGGTIEDETNVTDAVVRKLDASGREIDRYVYSGELGLDDGGRAVAVGDDGSVYLGGYESIVEDGAQQSFFRKFAADGEVLWTYTQASMYAEGYGAILGAAVAGDAIFVAGTEEVEDKVYEIFVHRLDPDDGAPVWTITIPESAGYASNGLVVEASGDLILAATVVNADDEGLPLVTRLAAVDGAEVWARNYGGGRAGFARALAIDGRGHLAVAGQLVGEDTQTWDFWAAHLDADGEVVWSAEYDHDELTDIGTGVAWAAGDVVASGFVTRLNEQTNMFVRRFDAEGAPYWTSEYNNPDLGLYDELYAMAADDERVVVVGNETVKGKGTNQWIRAYEP